MKIRSSFGAAVAAASMVGLVACSAFESDKDKRVAVTDTSMYGGMPANAVRAAQGYGTVRYRASAPSHVIIGDDSARKVITETNVQAGDEIVVDAEGDRVLVNGTPVYQQNLLKNDQHSIYVVSR